MFARLDVHELSSAASGKQSTKVSGSETDGTEWLRLRLNSRNLAGPSCGRRLASPCSALNQKREAP
jgi:hypothetical protein